jgi:hypothetical protein
MRHHGRNGQRRHRLAQDPRYQSALGDQEAVAEQVERWERDHPPNAKGSATRTFPASSAQRTAVASKWPDANGATSEDASEAHVEVTSPNEWREPQPLPKGLAQVDDFDLRFLPAALQPWVGDISDRLQCPPDYVGVSAIVALGAVVGRRIGIKPQTKTDWLEVPNIWGGFIDRPGMLKSPAMQEALKPLHRLEAEAAKENEIAKEAHEAGLSAYKVRQQVKVALEKEALKKAKSGKIEGINFELGDEPKEPAAIRFRTNDSSYEALGELLKDNASGILIERDELVSLLKHLDREEQVVARGFFLSGWSGTQPYSFDRIGRGHVNLDAVCISVLGGTQPVRISEYVRRANFGGSGGDGLIQRFGALVWPDVSATWRNVDEYPNSEARERAWQVFDRAAKLDLQTALKLGASKGQFDKLPCLRFDDAAHEDFLGRRADLETRLRTGAIHAALEGHLAKYRKLVPALALINSIADGDEGAVTRESLLRALAFSAYLESHAHRIYGSGMEGETAAASAILKHIQAGEITNGFTARDILRHGWAHLSDREQIEAGLILLSDLDYISAQVAFVRPQGGRPKVTYAINPTVRS